MSDEVLKIHGVTIRLPLEQVVLWKVRSAAESMRAQLEHEGVTVGPLHHRCYPSRWVEVGGERFFMPGEVIYWREGTRL